ncbi:MAG: adenylosuccinate lyase, partial [Myxococcales bacterium]
MIARYSPPEFSSLWSSEHRFAVWLEVELAACEAMEEAGTVPKGTSQTIRDKKLVLDPNRIDEIERTTKHDVIAFLTHVEELA